MYIATVPNRNSPPAILLRESNRENGKVKTRTIANLSSLPPNKIAGLRRVLRGDVLLNPEEEFENTRSLPHGHIAAVLGTLKKIGLNALLETKQSRQRDLATAMIVWRVIDPVSKRSHQLGKERARQHDHLLHSLRKIAEDVRMFLIDPKIVELKSYNRVPHLLTPVITEPRKAFQALQYCIAEMERRYTLLDALAVRDIRAYNRKARRERVSRLPYIVNFDLAAAMYEKAWQCIERDSNLRDEPSWRSLIGRIKEIQNMAISRQPPG